MGQVVVYQLHVANVIGVRHFHLVLVFLRGGFAGFRVGDGARPRPGFGAVAGFRFNGLRQGVLQPKQPVKVALYFIQRIGPAMKRRQDGSQHIGVMADVVQIIAVFVIAGVQAFVVVKLMLQVGLQIRIGGFGPQHIVVLGQIGRGRKPRPGAAKHGGAGLQAAHNQQEHEAHAADQQRPFPVTDKERRPLFAFLGGFLGGCGAGLRRLGGGSRRALCRLACGPRCLGVVPLDFLLLPEPGHGIAHRLRQLRVIPQRFLVDILGVGGNGFPFRLGCGPVGFELVVPDAAADGLARLPFGKFLPLVAALHAHVFALDFMDFAVDEQPGFLNRAAHGIGL